MGWGGEGRAGPVGVGQLFRRGGGRERRGDGERGRSLQKLRGPQPLAQCLENSRLGGKGREGNPHFLLSPISPALLGPFLLPPPFLTPHSYLLSLLVLQPQSCLSVPETLKAPPCPRAFALAPQVPSPALFPSSKGYPKVQVALQEKPSWTPMSLAIISFYSLQGPCHSQKLLDCCHMSTQGEQND